MSNSTINPHPDMQISMNVVNDGMRRMESAFPDTPTLAFSGEDLTIAVTQTTSISTVGPADGLGFAKKGLTVIAEGLTYKMASKVASTKSRGTVSIVLMYRENGIGGRPSGPIKQDRYVVHGSKTIRLNQNKNYRVYVEPRMSGAYKIKLLVKSYRSDRWA